MHYPQAEDYIRAVQQPDRSFRRPELRAAAFEVHPVFGIPMPASGNAAVVFRAEVGGADTALRFFIRDDASTRERYTALGRHFAEFGIEDCVAHPTWLDDAIALNDATWPMVRMNWVEGRTLDEYVGHLARGADTAALTALARTWRGFVGRLQEADFAHGDLQHGNILVDTSSALRLVDFDGSWIAGFEGSPPPRETGHPNYQPATRRWGRWMDTFPGLVIYTALLTLSRRPGSWAQLPNGENILFSAADFVPPFQTPTWQTVASVADEDVVVAAERLQRLCASGWGADEPLETLLTARPRIEVRSGRLAADPQAPPVYPGVHLPSQPPQWWQAGPAPTPPGSADRPPEPAVPAPPAGEPVPTGPSEAAAMPPPPPKERPGSAAAGPEVSFGARNPASWYGASPRGSSGPGNPPGKSGYLGAAPKRAPSARPAGSRRPAGEIVALLVAIVALTAFVSGVAVQAAGGNGGLAAGVSALVAALLALPLLARRSP
jgi:hypothetical protein